MRSSKELNRSVELKRLVSFKAAARAFTAFPTKEHIILLHIISHGRTTSRTFCIVLLCLQCKGSSSSAVLSPLSLSACDSFCQGIIHLLHQLQKLRGSDLILLIYTLLFWPVVDQHYHDHEIGFEVVEQRRATTWFKSLCMKSMSTNLRGRQQLSW
jgi:hypothetical protein